MKIVIIITTISAAIVLGITILTVTASVLYGTFLVIGATLPLGKPGRVAMVLWFAWGYYLLTRTAPWFMHCWNEWVDRNPDRCMAFVSACGLIKIGDTIWGLVWLAPLAGFRLILYPMILEILG